jgi:hypothetical protein
MNVLNSMAIHPTKKKKIGKKLIFSPDRPNFLPFDDY